RLLHGRHPGSAGQRIFVAGRERRVLRGRRVHRRVPTFPLGALRTAARRGLGRISGQHAADRDRSPSGRRRRCTGLHQQGPVHGDDAGTGRGHRHSGDADHPHQRAGLLTHDARRVGREDQGNRRRGAGPGRRRASGTRTDPRTRNRAMTATAPSDVQPSERAADASNGVPVRRASAVWILIAGVIGLAAAFTLTVEKIEILINPAYVPTCSINPVLSCGSVMVTPQASAFGFPNPLIGIVAFTVVVVTGVLAVANIRLPRWYWAG